LDILGLKENKDCAEESMKMHRSYSTYSVMPLPRYHFFKLLFMTDLFIDVVTTAYHDCELLIGKDMEEMGS
jgi:hypothetical protein